MTQLRRMLLRLGIVIVMFSALAVVTYDWLRWQGLGIFLIALVTCGLFLLVLLLPSIGLLICINGRSTAYYKVVSWFMHFMTAWQCYCIWQSWPLDGYHYEGGGHYYHSTAFGVGFVVALLVYWLTVQIYAYWQLKDRKQKRV